MTVLDLPHGVWWAAFWAGMIALDITAFGPWMISQPMVCGPLFGWLLHDVWAGVVIGGVVQLLWMDVTPVGVGIPFDVTAVTLLAVYWASLMPAGDAAATVLALLVAAPFGFVFRAMDQWARRLNTQIARKTARVADASLPWALSAATLVGVVWSWLRYAACYAIVMAVGQHLWLRVTGPVDKPWITQGLTTALVLLPMAGMGVVLELFLSEEPESRSFSMRPKGRS